MAATSESDSGKFDSKAWWTAPKKNFRSSARLHLQHLLFQRTLNNRLLHPDIEAFVQSQASSSQPLRIADIGCGNGIWLLDLHEHLNSLGITNFTIDGLDINPINFPPPQTMPSSISLKEVDMEESHPQLEGTYDIVHIRAWTSMVKGGDPSPIIATVHRLLKPSGFIQWEESRVDLQQASAPPGVSKQMTDTMITTIFEGGRRSGNTYDFLSSPTFENWLETGGFADVKRDENKKRQMDMKAWTEDYLMVWEEIPDLIPDEKARDGMIQLFMACVKETEQGVVVHHEAVVMMTGRKGGVHSAVS